MRLVRCQFLLLREIFLHFVSIPLTLAANLGISQLAIYLYGAVLLHQQPPVLQPLQQRLPLQRPQRLPQRLPQLFHQLQLQLLHRTTIQFKTLRLQQMRMEVCSWTGMRQKQAIPKSMDTQLTLLTMITMLSVEVGVFGQLPQTLLTHLVTGCLMVTIL